MTTEADEARIRTLEHQVRWMRLALYGLGVVLLGGVSLGLVSQQDEPREIRATGLSIVDPKGRSRIQMSVDSDGLPNIRLLESNGEWGAKLGSDGGLGSLILGGEKKGGMKLAGGSEGFGSVSVGTPGGGLVLVSCSPKSDPIVQVLGPDKRTILDTSK